MRITIEIPRVEACGATGCAYNVDEACHARAITVGDGVHPGCDTYVVLGRHVADRDTTAGVGACKVEACRHNEDLECTAGSIRVDRVGDQVECETYET